MNRFDPVPIIIGFLTLAIISLVVIFGTNNSSGNSNNNSQTPPTDKVTLELAEEELYLSKNTFVEQKDIAINNISDGELELYDLVTSCDCFKVNFINMTNKPLNDNKHTIVAAQSQTILRLNFNREKYDQVLSSDQSVTFKSNDINRKEITIPIYSLNL